MTKVEHIAKGEIGNALTSTADNHIVAVANDIYDEELEGYQSELNKGFREDIDSNLLAIELDEFGGFNVVTGEHSTLDFDETFINEEGLIQLTYNV